MTECPPRRWAPALDLARSSLRIGTRSGGPSNRFRNAVFLTIGANIAMSGITALSGLLLARMLGASDRGVVAALMTWLSVITVVGECGMTHTVCYFVARRPGEAADYVRTALRLMLVLGAAAALAGILLTPFIADDGHEWLFRASFLAEPLLFVGGVWMFAIQAVDLRAWNRARLVQPVVYTAGVLLLVVLDAATVTSAIAVMLLSIAIQTVLVRIQYRRRVAARGRARRQLLGPMLRYGASNLLTSSPSLVTLRLDQLVLAFIDSAQLGRYAVAVSLSGLVGPTVLAFGQVAMPRIAAADRRSPPPTRLVWGVVAGSAAFGAVAAALLCAVTPLLVHLLGPSFAGIGGLVWILGPASVVLGCNLVMGHVLRGCGRPLAVARAEGVAAAATAVLLAAMMPVLGVYGAALASLGASLTAAVVLVRAIRRELARWPAAAGPAEPAADPLANTAADPLAKPVANPVANTAAQAVADGAEPGWEPDGQSASGADAGDGLIRRAGGLPEQKDRKTVGPPADRTRA